MRPRCGAPAPSRLTQTEQVRAENLFLELVQNQHWRMCYSLQRRGEDKLAEFDDLLSLSFWIVSHLLRSATPIDKQLPPFQSRKRQLAKYDALCSSSKYLFGEERAALEDFQDHVRAFLESLQTENPKSCRMRDLLAKQSAAIICPDARLVADLERHYADRASHILATNQADSEFADGAIIPGWFRKFRMASLLSPPISDPLTMLLYAVETSWYAGCTSQRPDHEFKKVSILAINHSTSATWHSHTTR